MTPVPRYGVVFPSTEIGNDPADVQRFAVEVEGLGYDHLITFDHVVGADPAAHGALAGPYTHEHPFHEPFVLFGFLANACRLELVTGILVLPQRQTVLVAKQAAEVDVLSGGRLRLGVGIGWNSVEYEALGQSFETRGRRMGEQIELMRKLWAGGTVTFEGREHTVTSAALLPTPVRGTVPVWIGCGRSPAALERVARHADGWMPLPMKPESYDASLAVVRDAAERLGRDPAGLGLQGLIRGCNLGEMDRIEAELELWHQRGATHIGFDTLWQDFRSVDEHLEVFAQITKLAGIPG